MTTENTKGLKKNTKFIFAGLLIILAIAGFYGIKFYRVYFAPNVSENGTFLYVHTGANIDQVFQEIRDKDLLKDVGTFSQAAAQMDLAERLKPGRYKLTKGMNNRTLINTIKSGNQTPVALKFQNIRKKDDFAGYLSRTFEADSLEFIKVLDSAALIEKYGFTPDNSYTMFIPNTYEMYWNTTPLEFFDRMQKEYTKFWTPERKQKASALNLTPQQVTILASIVDGEAIFDKEMPTIAGLYLNRLNKGILLQADPTVIFANNDFTVKRVTNALLRVDSKYNTYKYAGLPPGPIMMPSIKAIDAVLSPEKNNYIYMCAKEDFSGYHAFAETKEQHEINANKYRQALNKRNIFR
ncbi:endolytic transglycosylase MltG [Pedobacter antarcticus]|uniref:endolytic transglycosylase MltG n=1 Tax=Pedobacter antarcticus TaxID=34086 RepID=UPI001C563682|nr:endolytic transglycosylase MltG [Pedobacter antarcticus]